MNSKQVTEVKTTQVTLFNGGVQITKEVGLKLEKGTNYILISELPHDVVPESIHVSSNDTVQVLSVTHQINYQETQTVNERIKALEEKIEEVDIAISKKSSYYDVSVQEADMLLMGRDLSSSKEQFKIEEYRQAVDFFGQKMKEVKLEQGKLEREIQELEDERNRLYQEMGDMNSTNQPISEVIVELVSDNLENQLELEYYTKLAGWNVKYDIRVDEINEPAKLIMKAEVYQNTGEDWQDIQMTLSSGNPTLGVVQPHLQPWYLDFIQPQIVDSRVKEWNHIEVMKKVAIDTPAIAELSAEEYAMPPRVEVNHNQASIEFAIPATVTILSHEPAKTLDILTHELTAEYKYYNVRKLDKDTFLLAIIKGWEELNLLEGPVSIFLESTYVGKTYLNPREIEDQLEVSLGRDKSVLVTRVKGSDYKSKTIFGGNTKDTRSFDLTVRNLKNKMIKMEVLDQIPVSVNKEIVIELTDSSGANLDKDTGKLTWKFELEPGHSKVFTVKYVVTYPQTKKIVLE